MYKTKCINQAQPKYKENLPKLHDDEHHGVGEGPNQDPGDGAQGEDAHYQVQQLGPQYLDIRCYLNNKTYSFD